MPRTTTTSLPVADVFDFALTPEEVAAIDGLDTGVRGGPNQDEVDFLTFNRVIPD